MDTIISELNVRSSQRINAIGLVFTRTPRAEEEPPIAPSMNKNDLRLSTLALSQDRPENERILRYEEWLIYAKHIASNQVSVSVPTNAIVEKLEEEFKELQSQKLSEWKRQQALIKDKERIRALTTRTLKPDKCTVIDTGRSPYFTRSFYFSITFKAACFSRHSFSMHHAIFACYFIVAALHLLCGLSVDDCSFLLPGIELVIRLGADYIDSTEDLLKAFPRDIRTVKKALQLTPVVTPFVNCPKCFALYSKNEDVPPTCPYKETVSSNPCGEALITSKQVGNKRHPAFTREYIHQSLQSWLSTLICRPGMESNLDRDVLADCRGEITSDIFGGTTLQEFLGPDGLPFLPPKGSEGRYIFSLSVDAFNPFLNKQAGKKASSTAIYMVCLNLPPSIRYKAENMYLAGVIPGPREPSLTQINHLLEPLVEELLELWTPGIWLTRTPQWECGRLIRAALVPLVCDLKAARQVMGHGSHSAKKFCSICRLTRDEIDVLDSERLVEISSVEYRRHAMEWKDAISQSQRERVFKKYGIRWSVLLRLPYWDPPRFTVVDTMHTVLLGHLHRHCSILWGMNPKRSEAHGGRSYPSASKVHVTGLSYKVIMSTAWDIRTAPEKKICGRSKAHLWGFCLQNGLVTAGSMDSYTEKELQEKVLGYVST